MKRFMIYEFRFMIWAARWMSDPIHNKNRRNHKS
ncbi:hypothetical protein BOVAB4_2895 [Bacteroides ovatus]|nr:hypothetical protein BOVAB4_2895 [Bacteroides ovatus]